MVGSTWGWCLVGVVLVLATGSARGHEVTLPDVIIGDPNETDNDLLGPPISRKEVLASIRTLEEGGVEGERKGVEEEDPITFPSSRYFEGDIMVASEDHLYQILEGDPQGQLSAIKNQQRTWPRGVIPYVISATYSSSERGIIGQAMAEFSAKTCLRFLPRTASHNDYIHILRGQGCSSSVGRNGGVQVVSLGRGCVHKGVVVHELMHAAGFWHEQSRSDRDNYVTINWSNIVQGLSYNFNKKSNSVTTDLGLPYDYASIMHYGPYAFARSRSTPTIYPKRSGVTIGQRKGLSELDTKRLNLLYRCTGVGPTTPKPEPTCTDSHVYCPSWARAGYCTYTPTYMKMYCKKSCNVCGRTRGCENLGQHCQDWARNGECTSNPAYMNSNCAKSCNIC